MARAAQATTEFSRAFCDALQRSGDTLQTILKIAGAPTRDSLLAWRTGLARPGVKRGQPFVRQLEARWALTEGALVDLIAVKSTNICALLSTRVRALSPELLHWHLPSNFAELSLVERQAIEKWLADTFVNADAQRGSLAKKGYANPFQAQRLAKPAEGWSLAPNWTIAGWDKGRHRRSQSVSKITDKLFAGWRDLIDFKTRPILPVGRLRDRVWNCTTCEINSLQLGLMFAFLSAETPSAPIGAGYEIEDLSFGHLVFPAVWDLYLQERVRARAEWRSGEMALLSLGRGLTRPDVGWLWQSPHFANELIPLAGLVTEADIVRAKNNWQAVCTECHAFLKSRARDVKRIVVTSQDLDDPIAVVLRHPRPLELYRRIADEALRPGDDGGEEGRAAARRRQFHLMVTLAMHTGFRSRTLRQLHVARHPNPRTSIETLQLQGRGELYFDDTDSAWDIVAPATAFKNASSSVFRHGPHEMRLPNVGSLYDHLDRFLRIDRPCLLRDRPDPETLFVNTGRGIDATFTNCEFYQAWRRGVEFYGIYNPWTKRGAVQGLRPHGPHAVRSVIATHIAKQTGSFILAGYALQNTPITMQRHYVRRAARDRTDAVQTLLRSVWEDVAPRLEEDGREPGQGREPKVLFVTHEWAQGQRFTRHRKYQKD